MKNTQPIEKPVSRGGGVVEVHSIFDTIQGEGPYAGTPAVFVRLAGCNLQCELCFGIDNKGRIPYLSLAHGSKIRLDKVQVGAEILTFDENLNLTITQVQSVLDRVVHEWMEVVIGGKRYDVTPEHPFFTSRGLVEAGQLLSGDQVLEARPEELIAWKKTGDRNPMKQPEVVAKRLLSVDYEEMGRKVSETRLARFADGTLISPFHTLSEEQQERIRQQNRERMTGEGNPNWNGGPPPNLTALKQKIASREVLECIRCGSVSRLLVHHVDGDHSNDDAQNLEAICHPCHNQIHERGYNFWNGTRSDGKELVAAHNGQEVQSICRRTGSLLVRNLSCSPHNTFLANRMWVHNCDTEYTAKRELMTPTEVVHSVQYTSTKPRRLVVITGGEPFRQNISQMVQALFMAGHLVQIETNGTIAPIANDSPWGMYPEERRKRVCVVCSPKTPKLADGMWQYIDAVKYVVAWDKVDVDGLPLSSVGPQYGRPARPPVEWKGEIFVQPLDEEDKINARFNTQQAVKSCLRFGHRLCIQTHKLCNLP
jgi:organic radical activating enzyme/5-methylcytosine-specific restriction endonuclease McrA